MTRVAMGAALAALAVAVPATAQVRSAAADAPDEPRGPLAGLLTALEVEAGLEFSGSQFHEGETILGALTIQGRDFGDTHDDMRRIALRATRANDEVVEVSIAVSLTTADSRGALVVGSTGFNPATNAPYDIVATFGDYEKLGIELGARRYLVDRHRVPTRFAMTPFVGGSIGAAQIEAINATFVSDGFDELGIGLPDTIVGGFFDESWVPTASVAAGLQLNLVNGISVEGEVGARWDGAPDENDDTLALAGLERINDTAGRFSYPVMVRGRVDFQKLGVGN